MSSRSNLCYKCNQPGHFARECPDGDGQGGRSSGRGSFGGGRSSYGSYRGGSSGGGSGSSHERSGTRCYRCNQTGHFVRDCPSDSNESVCYNCNETGHLSRDCREPRSGPSNNFRSSNRGGPGQTVCYRCSKPGHYARECNQPDMRGSGPTNVSSHVTGDEENN